MFVPSSCSICVYLPFSPQRGRLVHGVVAVRAGISALLPEVRPPAPTVPAEGGRSALPAGPPAHCPAHQRRGEGAVAHLRRGLFFTGLDLTFCGFRSWLRFVPGIFLLSQNATRKPVKVWRLVSAKITHISQQARIEI